MNRDFGDLRRSYERAELLEQDTPHEPLGLFQIWFELARERGETEPNAMSLATVAEDGRPSVRVVLMKGVHEGGLVFYTNYASRKGRELAGDPRAAVSFWWPTCERQVRMEGRVERLAPELSDAYYAARPAGSQIGAWASPQSEVLPDRAALDRLAAETVERFAGAAPPRPEHWGGLRLVPDTVEFWQGRKSRLHDRLRYRKAASEWLRERLAP